MNFILGLILFLSVSPVFASEPASEVDASFRFRSACTRAEVWNFGEGLDSAWSEIFNDYLAQRMSPLRGFAEAMTLRAQAKNEESRIFAEYWASLALFDAKLPHIAHTGFSSIAKRELGLHARAVQIASIGCLLEIQKKTPSLSLSDAVKARIFALPKHPVTYEAAALHMMDLLVLEGSNTELDRTLRYLEGGGVHQSFANALYAAQRGKHTDTIAWMKKVLLEQGAEAQQRYQDVAHLLMSRAYFTLKQYDASIRELKLVKKSSNELSHTLSELAWAQLKSENYQDAIGISTSLQSGGLKNTFAPESYMIMAMAFNEICHYPESLKAIQHLKEGYGSSHRWLQDWYKVQKTAASGSLYSMALAHLRKTAAVPVKVANEWLRSPLFFSRQEEINTIFEERRRIASLGEFASKEVNKMAVNLLALVKKVKPLYIKAKAETPDGQPLPEKVEAELKKLRRSVTTYRRMKRGAEPWQKILAYFGKSSPSVEKNLVKAIDADLVRMNQRMLIQLNEVADNTHFIEVEIFNGASQDMVWQNAHPDFKEVSKKMEDEADRRPAGAAVWDWGNISGGLSGSQEIWEDELGSFRAELQDNCSNREKYISLKNAAKRGQ